MHRRDQGNETYRMTQMAVLKDKTPECVNIRIEEYSRFKDEFKMLLSEHRVVCVTLASEMVVA